MSTGAKIALAVLAVVVIAAGIYMIDIDQTAEGNLPEYDAEVGSVDVTSEEQTVTLPDVDVTTEETTVTVPDVTVTPPSE